MNKDDQELFNKIQSPDLYMFLLPVKEKDYVHDYDVVKTEKKYDGIDVFTMSGLPDYYLFCANSYYNINRLVLKIKEKIRYLIKSEERDLDIKDTKEFEHRGYIITYSLQKKDTIGIIDLFYYTLMRFHGEKLTGFRALSLIDKLRFLEKKLADIKLLSSAILHRK